MPEYPTCRYCGDLVTSEHASECSAFHTSAGVPRPGSWKHLEKQAREEKARELGMPSDTPMSVLRAQERFRWQHVQAGHENTLAQTRRERRAAERPRRIALAVSLGALTAAPAALAYVATGSLSLGVAVLLLLPIAVFVAGAWR